MLILKLTFICIQDRENGTETGHAPQDHDECVKCPSAGSIQHHQDHDVGQGLHGHGDDEVQVHAPHQAPHVQRQAIEHHHDHHPVCFSEKMKFILVALR
jgi:hypothetical protein